MADFWQQLGDAKRLLILAPHPDDEVFGLGGLMSLASRRGLVLTVLAVTDGEASHPHSTLITPDALRERRLGEIQRAYVELGIEPQRVRLGLPDSAVSEEGLRALLPDFVNDDDVVIAPLADDGHPDHDACGCAAAGLASAYSLPLFAYPIWASFQAASRAFEGATAWQVPMPDEVLEAKRRAMACFASQFLALGPAIEDGPVLPDGFEAPFHRAFEVLYS